MRQVFWIRATGRSLPQRGHSPCQGLAGYGDHQGARPRGSLPTRPKHARLSRTASSPASATSLWCGSRSTARWQFLMSSVRMFG